MALQHKLSDAVSIELDENDSSKVIEIEFKFIRYRLVLDDFEKSEQLLKILQEAKIQPHNVVETPSLPKFYKETKQNEM